jgi:uracil-DNA glycosylase
VTGTWWKTLARRGGKCGRCGLGHPQGAVVLYRHDDKAVLCLVCGKESGAEARPSNAYLEALRLAEEQRDHKEAA